MRTILVIEFVPYPCNWFRGRVYLHHEVEVPEPWSAPDPPEER